MAETVSERLAAAWARTDRIFELLVPGAFLARPIALRHPFIFYVGHLPAFAWNHICAGVLERSSLNAAFDELFSRGIDPDVDDPTHCHAHPEVPDSWPPLAEVLAYRDRVRAAVLDSIDAVSGRAPANLMARDERVFSMVIEHELMHQRRCSTFPATQLRPKFRNTGSEEVHPGRPGNVWCGRHGEAGSRVNECIRGTTNFQ